MVHVTREDLRGVVSGAMGCLDVEFSHLLRKSFWGGLGREDIYKLMVNERLLLGVAFVSAYTSSFSLIFLAES